MVGWWPGDGNTQDIIGSINGVNLGGVTYQSGRVDQALQFDGTDDLIAMEHRSEYDITGDLTIDLWAKKKANGGSQTLISKGGGYIPQDVPTAYMLRFVDDRIQAVFEPIPAGNNQVLEGGEILDTAWHFYAYVRSGTTHRLYVDNVLAASGTFTALPASTTGLPLTIGAQRHDPFSTGFDYSNFFEGMIDEVEIFNRALSLEELEMIYSAGSYGKCKDTKDCIGSVDSTVIDTVICHGQEYFGYSQSGIYIDTYPGSDGCDSVRVLQLTVLDVDSTVIDTTICSGAEVFGYDQPGIYHDTFQSITGCDSIRKLILRVDQPVLYYLADTICFGENLAGHSATGIYEDLFVTASGCDSLRILELTVSGLLIPNAFTPDGDGLNDVFRPISSGSAGSHLRIYNRWGEMVFESDEEKSHWDGKYLGQDQPMDVYIYTIEYSCGGSIQLHKGNVTLIR